MPSKASKIWIFLSGSLRDTNEAANSRFTWVLKSAHIKVQPPHHQKDGTTEILAMTSIHFLFWTSEKLAKGYDNKSQKIARLQICLIKAAVIIT